MRDPDPGTPYVVWAASVGLQRSRRPACGHGLRAQRLSAPTHRQAHAALCLGTAARPLLARASLWARAGEAVLLTANPWAPPMHHPAHEAWAERARAYCAALGVTYLVVHKEPVPEPADGITVVLARDLPTLRHLLQLDARAWRGRQTSLRETRMRAAL